MPSARGYISLRTPDLATRTPIPLALIYDGFRWYVRAHDAGGGGGRPSCSPGCPRWLTPAKLTSDDDHAWGTRVSIEIAPHRGLDNRQRQVIASDYGMTTKQRLVLKVREGR